MRDIDVGESVNVNGTNGNPVFVENIEFLAGETSGFANYNPALGRFTSGGTNYRDAMVVVDISGLEDITINRTGGQWFRFAIIGPEIAYTDYETTFTEDGPAVSIADTDTLVQDADDTNIESALNRSHQR